MPVWHASVALHSAQGLVPITDWSPSERLRAIQLLVSALHGVGRRQEVHETTRCSIQVRRLASEAEMLIVGPAKDVR